MRSVLTAERGGLPTELVNRRPDVVRTLARAEVLHLHHRHCIDNKQ